MATNKIHWDGCNTPRAIGNNGKNRISVSDPRKVSIIIKIEERAAQYRAETQQDCYKWNLREERNIKINKYEDAWELNKRKCWKTNNVTPYSIYEKPGEGKILDK